MNKKNMFLLPFFSLFLLSSCVADSSSAESGETYVTDSANRKVAVKKGSYRRIVCIGAGALRLYSYVGEASLLAGVEDIDNESLENRPKMFDGVARPYFIAYHEQFASLPSCGVGGPNAQNAEPEKILSCSPDLILSEYEDADKANALQEQTGVPVLTLGYGSSGVFDQKVKDSLALLGKVLGKEEKASSLISFIDSEKQEISQRTEKVKEEDKPIVYLCGLGNWGTTNHLYTAQNYEPFNVAHIKNAVNDLKVDGIQKIDAEKFASIGESADKIIIDAAAIKNIKPIYEESKELFESTKAWQSGEVYLEMAYNAYYTNLEIALANTWYCAKIVYPSLFEDIDIASKTDQVTNAFLGKRLYSEIAGYPSSFGGYQKINVKEFFQ